MRGNPLIRLMFLGMFLLGAGLLVARIAGPADEAGPDVSGDRESTPSGVTEQRLAAYVRIELSGPARRIAWRGPGDETPPLFELLPEGLLADTDFDLVLSEGSPEAALLQVDWERADVPNFLRLVVEPESLETREETIYFPPGETTAGVDMSWRPAAP